MRISPQAAALAAALAFVTTTASADPTPRSTYAPWEEPGDSASVEILRVAHRAVGRFAEVQIDSAGRIIDSPPGLEDILINNPAGCSPADALLTAPTL